MDKSPEKVSDSFIVAIIIHIYVGWGFLYLIHTAVGYLTHNAYMGLLTALVVILPFFWIAADLAKMYPNQRISVIFEKVYGRFGGKAVGIVFIIFLFFFLTFALRNTHLMIYSYFFRTTPLFLITLFFLAGALYNAIKGVKSVGRLAAFMLIPPLLIIFGLEVLALKNINPINIQPVFEGSPEKWLSASLDLPFILLPGTAVFVYLPYIRTVKSVTKIGLISLGIIVPVFMVALLGTIGVFGPGLAAKMGWPVVEYFHLVDYPYLLLEQAGLFFLIAWYPFHFIGTSQGLFVIANELNGLFPKISRPWYTVAVFFLVLAVVNIPLNIVYLGQFFGKYRRWFTYTYLGILAGTWLIAKLRFVFKKRRVNN